MDYYKRGGELFEQFVNGNRNSVIQEVQHSPKKLAGLIYAIQTSNPWPQNGINQDLHFILHVVIKRKR